VGIGAGAVENMVVGGTTNPLAGDLDQVLAHTEGLWEDLRGQRVFMTGGTGFFGCWLLESLLWANDKLKLDASVVVLTRHEDAFGKKAPHLARHRAVSFHHGDVRTFDFPEGPFSYVIHAATPSGTTLTDDGLLSMFDTIVTGTRRTLEFARCAGVRRFLLTSSGAVYGQQPADLSHLSEDDFGGPDPMDVRSAYGEGKRAAETLCALYGHQHGVDATIARCFAFVGPYLPLDVHFAAGNFIRDGLKGGPIHIDGDGTPFRSYLYAADLAIWLWTILLRARPLRPYNVGAAEALTIADLANLVARTFVPPVPVETSKILSVGVAPSRYVPAVTRAETELGLRATVPVADGVRRTIAWHQRRATLAEACE
jgi:nucleoside-diphosphate-sugar epimerase